MTRDIQYTNQPPVPINEVLSIRIDHIGNVPAIIFDTGSFIEWKFRSIDDFKRCWSRLKRKYTDNPEN